MICRRDLGGATFHLVKARKDYSTTWSTRQKILSDIRTSTRITVDFWLVWAIINAVKLTTISLIWIRMPG
jgi:hypothetical protein